MTPCTSCNKQCSLFEYTLNGFRPRCKVCEERFTRLQQEILRATEDLFKRDMLTYEKEQSLYHHFQQVNMPQELGAPVIERMRYLRGLFEKRMRYLRALSEIRAGNVPRIATTIHLDSDEYAHFELQVTYFKPNKKIKVLPGRLIGTNKKCYFLSNTGADSATIDWNNVSEAAPRTIEVPSTTSQYGKTKDVSYKSVQVLHIVVSRGSGGGGYQVPDMLYAKTIIDSLVRLWKRQLVLYKEQAAQGIIPEHIKAAVFQRDQGRCIQCGYQGVYIEYDHKHPRSKGGQNTVDNIQLLCRMCNLKKGSRV